MQEQAASSFLIIRCDVYWGIHSFLIVSRMHPWAELGESRELA
jgi:hypothetical protein